MKKSREHDDYFFDDEFESRKNATNKRQLNVLLKICAVISIALLGNTLASNISLSSGGAKEFGQGVQLTTACDRNIEIQPYSSYVQNETSGSHLLTSISINKLDGTVNTGGADEGCRGKFFTIKAYSNSSATVLAEVTFNVNSDGSLTSGDGITDVQNVGTSNSSLRINFENPTFTTSNMYRFTLESIDGYYEFAQLPNPSSGLGLFAISPMRSGVLYVNAADTDSNGNCISCLLYRSDNFGISWTLQGALPEFLWHIVGSADGTKLVGANWGGHIFTSNNSGQTWVDRGNGDAWWHLSSSASGQVVAGVTEKIGFKLSHDYGVTWSSPLPPPSGSYVQSAISDDGTKILVSQSGSLHFSSDSGTTWATRGENKNWSAVAMSSDGSHLYAAEMKDVGQTEGRIYSSTDYGLTWKASSVNNSWWNLRTNPSGKVVVASAADVIDSIFISNDYGSTWRRSTKKYYVESFALSNSGEKILSLNGNVLYGNVELFSVDNLLR